MKRANRFSLSVYQMGQRVSRLYSIWVDGGEGDPPFFKSVMDSWGWMIQVVLRPQQTQGFVLLKKRSVVEQTFGWLNWYRGLSKDDRFHDSACGQAISLSWYPLPLFIQPLRLAVNYQINTSDCFMAHA
jgi:transposase